MGKNTWEQILLVFKYRQLSVFAITTSGPMKRQPTLAAHPPFYSSG